MPKRQVQEDDEPRMLGYEAYANMPDSDRKQEVWDRAMWPEAKEFMEKLMAFQAGRGPDPGDYKGRVVDFEKAIADLEHDEPDPDRE